MERGGGLSARVGGQWAETQCVGGGLLAVGSHPLGSEECERKLSKKGKSAIHMNLQGAEDLLPRHAQGKLLPSLWARKFYTTIQSPTHCPPATTVPNLDVWYETEYLQSALTLQIKKIPDRDPKPW